jgi:hypothetical protein
MSKPTLNERIRELCNKRGLTFKPWQCEPWAVDDGPSPWPPTTAGAVTWTKARALRKELIAELKAERS